MRGVSMRHESIQRLVSRRICAPSINPKRGVETDQRKSRPLTSPPTLESTLVSLHIGNVIARQQIAP